MKFITLAITSTTLEKRNQNCSKSIKANLSFLHPTHLLFLFLFLLFFTFCILVSFKSHINSIKTLIYLDKSHRGPYYQSSTCIEPVKFFNQSVKFQAIHLKVTTYNHINVLENDIKY